MCALAPPCAVIRGKMQKGLYGSSSSICAQDRSDGGGVSVPSCAQAQRVYGGAEPGEMPLRSSPRRFWEEGRMFSTGKPPLSMILT